MTKGYSDDSQYSEECCLLGNQRAEWVWDPSEEDSAAIDVLTQLSKEGAEEEHHIVEWVESVPEGRADESSKVVHGTWLLALDEGTVVNVELQPEMDLVIPVLHHYLGRETELNCQDIDAVDLVKLLHSVLVFARVGKS